LAFACLACSLALSGVQSQAAEEPAVFARTTIDLGMVVADVDKSVEFYTTAVGFKEVEGFSVSGEFCADTGLTSGSPLKIRVLMLGKDETATKLKLMAAPAGSKKGDTAYVPSQLGFRYLTIMVTDTTAALARLKKAGVKTVAKSPVELPKNLPQGVYLTVVRDPDGNFVELVGPKK